MTIIYTAEVVSTGDGRNGRAQSSDGLLDLALRSPKDLGGAGDGTNPEQLFAAGYAACFHSALRVSARERRIDLLHDTVTARIGLDKDDSGYQLQAELVIALPGLSPEIAAELTSAAHTRCPYSRAVDGNVAVRLSTSV